MAAACRITTSIIDRKVLPTTMLQGLQRAWPPRVPSDDVCRGMTIDIRRGCFAVLFKAADRCRERDHRSENEAPIVELINAGMAHFDRLPASVQAAIRAQLAPRNEIDRFSFDFRARARTLRNQSTDAGLIRAWRFRVGFCPDTSMAKSGQHC